ncbi:uncharacterized protein DUF4262 [Nocardia tenerifensis]|uniref:Uncharacterized protein DUF4262 n=1 Tax=Nocardia tenerifensis TaxID=228006 RepID=A0A318KA75_9NOCA|nr:uncharacterized protein DUF4262 [Nocardia tenerifensis]
MICQDYGDRADMHPGDQRLVDNVGRFGWGVLSIPESDTSGPWAFTVGLWHTYRVPEVALFGISPDNAMGILNLVGDQIAAGARPHVDQPIDDVLPDDYQMRLRPIAEPWRRPFFGTALRFYRATAEWPVLQCVWPDRSHRFPGDADYPIALEGKQPRLELTPVEHPEGGWTAYYSEWVEWAEKK